MQKLCDEIDVEFTHVNRFTNRHADSLTNSKMMNKISKRRTPAHGTFTISYMKMSGDWRHAVIQELKQSVSSVHMAKKDLKCFTKLCGNFDYKMSDGVLARCLGVEEAGSFSLPASWVE